MRHVGLVALVFTAGCSLVWSMDSYDDGNGTNARSDGGNGGASTSGGNGDASSSGASSGTTSSGTNGSTSGATGTDGGGTDAGKDAETCIDEPEPNDIGTGAQEIPVGTTCGRVLTSGDTDNYKLTATGAVTLGIELGPNIQVVINPEGSSGSDVIHTPGSYQKAFGAGTHSVILQTYDGVGAYKLRR